jgi:hypothetical protein
MGFKRKKDTLTEANLPPVMTFYLQCAHDRHKVTWVTEPNAIVFHGHGRKGPLQILKDIEGVPPEDIGRCHVLAARILFDRYGAGEAYAKRLGFEPLDEGVWRQVRFTRTLEERLRVHCSKYLGPRSVKEQNRRYAQSADEIAAPVAERLCSRLSGHLSETLRRSDVQLPQKLDVHHLPGEAPKLTLPRGYGSNISLDVREWARVYNRGIAVVDSVVVVQLLEETAEHFRVSAIRRWADDSMHLEECLLRRTGHGVVFASWTKPDPTDTRGRPKKWHRYLIREACDNDATHYVRVHDTGRIEFEGHPTVTPRELFTEYVLDQQPGCRRFAHELLRDTGPGFRSDIRDACKPFSDNLTKVVLEARDKRRERSLFQDQVARWERSSTFPERAIEHIRRQAQHAFGSVLYGAHKAILAEGDLKNVPQGAYRMATSYGTRQDVFLVHPIKYLTEHLRRNLVTVSVGRTEYFVTEVFKTYDDGRLAVRLHSFQPDLPRVAAPEQYTATLEDGPVTLERKDMLTAILVPKGFGWEVFSTFPPRLSET